MPRMREPYRSSEGAPSKRRRAADELIATYEAKLGPAGLLVVPASLRGRIEALRAAGVGESTSDDDRAELSEALEKAVGIAQERVDDLRAFPAELAPLHARDFAPEAFAVRGREIYTWHPNGQGKSPLAVALAKLRVRGTATTRSWSTVEKLLALLQAARS